MAEMIAAAIGTQVRAVGVHEGAAIDDRDRVLVVRDDGIPQAR